MLWVEAPKKWIQMVVSWVNLDEWYVVEARASKP